MKKNLARISKIQRSCWQKKGVRLSGKFDILGMLQDSR